MTIWRFGFQTFYFVHASTIHLGFVEAINVIAGDRLAGNLADNASWPYLALELYNWRISSILVPGSDPSPQIRATQVTAMPC